MLVYVYPKFRIEPSITTQEIANNISVALAVAFGREENSTEKKTVLTFCSIMLKTFQNRRRSVYQRKYVHVKFVCIVLYCNSVIRVPQYLSLVVRKPCFCICENKDADQLRGNREADQRLCFRYMDSTVPLLPESEISSL